MLRRVCETGGAGGAGVEGAALGAGIGGFGEAEEEEVWKMAGTREVAADAGAATAEETPVDDDEDAVGRGGVRSLSKKVFLVGRKISPAALTGVEGVDGRTGGGAALVASGGGSAERGYISG